MSDSETPEDIRERKKERLREQLGEGDVASGEPTGSAGDGAGAAPDEPIHVDTVADYREAVAEHDVVLVDFYADWCGPCKMLEPTVEALAADTSAAVLKVDVDAHQELAAEYGVRGVPTLVVFADGEPFERVVGVQDESSLRQLVERAGA